MYISANKELITTPFHKIIARLDGGRLRDKVIETHIR